MPGRNRNRIAMNPLLRKGGAHERSRSTARRDARQHLDELLEDWLIENGNALESSEEPDQDGKLNAQTTTFSND